MHEFCTPSGFCDTFCQQKVSSPTRSDLKLSSYCHFFIYYFVQKYFFSLTLKQNNGINKIDNSIFMPNDQLAAQLRTLGLNRSEITVYLYILENGVSTPPDVSHGTKIARTNCYNILNDLKDQGLVEEKQDKKRKAYTITDPQALVSSLEYKRNMAQRLLPDLYGLQAGQQHKPRVTYYDGVEKVKEIYRESLAAKKIVSIGPLGGLDQLEPGFQNYFMKEIADRQIMLSNLSNTPREQMLSIVPELAGLYQTKALSSEQATIPTNILVWDSTLAFITLDSPMFGTVIVDPLLTTTFKMIFETIWNKA